MRLFGCDFSRPACLLAMGLTLSCSAGCLSSPVHAYPFVNPDLLYEDPLSQQVILPGKGVDLNTASVPQLMTLDGMDESTALLIIEERENVGPLYSWQDVARLPSMDADNLTQLQRLNASAVKFPANPALKAKFRCRPRPGIGTGEPIRQ